MALQAGNFRLVTNVQTTYFKWLGYMSYDLEEIKPPDGKREGSEIPKLSRRGWFIQQPLS